MNQRIKTTLRALGKTGFAAADILRSPSPGPRILIYHQVEAGLGRQMEVTLADFRSQISWMQDNGSIATLESALAGRSVSDAPRTFVVTFDDGYEDVFRLAWPILKAGGIPFTMYLTTAPVESRQALTPGGRAQPLTWDQVSEMLESGLMMLGAHTHTHRDLRYLDEREISYEVERSNELIALRTGIVTQDFAYPWGYWSDIADRIVRRSYTTAVLGSGPPIDADTDLHLINRVPVQLSDTERFFRAKMTTGMRLEDRVRRVVGRYHGP